MAIQFNCPLCAAAIRVPDAAAGKLGKCPKCAAKVKVPTLEALGASPAAASSPPPAPAKRTRATTTAADPLPEAPAANVSPPAAVAAPNVDWLPSENDDEAAPAAAEPGAARARPRPPGPTRLRTAPRGRSFPTAWVVFGGCFILLGVVAFVISRNKESVKADVAGDPQAPMTTLETLIARDDIGLPDDQLEPVLKYLEEHPPSLKSREAGYELKFTGSTQGIRIRLIPNEDYQLVRVDPKSMKNWPKLRNAVIRKTAAARVALLRQSIKQLCTDLDECLTAGRKMQNLGVYHDPVAFNALAPDIARHLVGRREGKFFVCVYQDADGYLYFLVPIGVKQFNVFERLIPDEGTVLPDEFRLAVKLPEISG